jgi:outer membrane receptor for ferrienterochelin and colicin
VSSEGFSGKIDENTLILLNGKKISQRGLDKLHPDRIEAISVFKGVEAEEHFGKEGKDGVIEITTKPD